MQEQPKQQQQQKKEKKGKKKGPELLDIGQPPAYISERLSEFFFFSRLLFFFRVRLSRGP